MIIGAQLYTLRDYTQTEKDIAYTLQQVASMGYRSVHCSALGPIAPEKLRDLLDQNGLTCAITHIAPHRLLNDLPAVIREHQILSCKNIGLSIMPEQYRGSLEGLRAFERNFSTVVHQIKDAGMHFHYHNHDVEFIREGKQTLLDILLEEMPDAHLLLCAFWAQVAGANPLELLDRYANRIEVIHLKDMAVYPFSKSIGDQRMMVPVLEGNMNYEAILAKCNRIPTLTHALVEQDICQGNPFACMQTSLRNIEALGYHS